MGGGSILKKRNSRRRAGVAVGILAALLLPSNVLAHRVVRSDPNDTRGPLDIKKVSVSDNGAVSMTFRSRIRLRFFNNLNGAHWVILTRDGDFVDPLHVYAEKGWKNGREVLKCRLASRSGDRRGVVRGSFKGARIRCDVPDWAFGSFGRWRASSDFRGPKYSDEAPNRRSYRH